MRIEVVGLELTWFSRWIGYQDAPVQVYVGLRSDPTPVGTKIFVGLPVLVPIAVETSTSRPKFMGRTFRRPNFAVLQRQQS
jgi:hypothetical protein